MPFPAEQIRRCFRPPHDGLVLTIAAVIYLGCIVSPPSLMDDVDAVYATIARTMLDTGDWVTARLNGVLYVDKAPMQVWAMAASYAVFGVSDWAARIPMALAAVALCWLMVRFGRWAESPETGFYAGLSLAACVGLFLFTRVRIPDVALTLAVAGAVWGWFRALEPGEQRPRLWAGLAAFSVAVGLLLKGLVAAALPAGAGLVYLAATGRLRDREAWRRLHLGQALAILLLVAGPWHVLAIVQNPPYFDFTLESAPGEYRGFFWRYFVNEHLLRYLGLRYPKDYSTVPAAQYWLGHLLWLFPGSVFLPAAARLAYRPVDRAGRARLLALCWAGFVLVFFAFSTSQEYYTMPAYPAFALLIGSAAARGGPWARGGLRAAGVIALVAALAAGGVLLAVCDVEARGDISAALEQNLGEYTLSLGHMRDLTLRSFAWLRLPLALAAGAFAVGAFAALRWRAQRAWLGLALMMVLFFHAARLAMVKFDPYLSSRPIAEALNGLPEGVIVLDHEYYAFSSVVFYTGEPVLLLNGRKNNLEYGSNEPGAPDVFLKDRDLKSLWQGDQPVYLVTYTEDRERYERMLGDVVARLQAGGKVLLRNRGIGGGN